MMADVGVSISGMPGPPFGPSYRMMTMSPFRMRPAFSPSSISSSASNTRAGPWKYVPSLPVILATAPCGARFP